MNEKDSIRDFIYLDIERVRSFVAQLSKGLPSERTSGTEHQAGGELSGEGGIPFLAKASGSADYHFIRSSSETKSLHDYILTELISGLREKRLLTELPDRHFEWTRSAFSDGMFILVTGVVKIVDYKAGLEALQNLPKLMKTYVKLTSQGKSTKEQTEEARQLEVQFRAAPIKEAISFIDQFYSDLVRTKIFAFEDTSHAFIGTSDKAFFRYSPTALTGLYGSIIDANWRCLVQVNQGASQSLTAFANYGSQIEDTFEQVIDQLGGLINLTQGVQFPSIAVTPIAIFREITQK